MNTFADFFGDFGGTQCVQITLILVAVYLASLFLLKVKKENLTLIWWSKLWWVFLSFTQPDLKGSNSFNKTKFLEHSLSNCNDMGKSLNSLAVISRLHFLLTNYLAIFFVNLAKCSERERYAFFIIKCRSNIIAH